MSSDSDSDSLQNKDIEMSEEEEEEGDNIADDDDDDESEDDDDDMGEDEDDDEGEDESEVADLDASDTSSSDEETEDLQSNETQGKNVDKKALKKPALTIEEATAKKILEKYRERQGKQLYILFPKKLPASDEELQKKGRELSPLVTYVHKPRQKYARFCLMDFNSKEDREIALKSIKEVAKNNEDFKGVVAKIPRTDNENFIMQLIEKKLKSIENKKAKIRLRRASKQAKGKTYTSSIVIINLPKTSSVVEVRKLFPTAVDIQIKPSKDKMKDNAVATITLPSTKEASAAIKKNIMLGGKKLITRFDHQLKKTSNGKNKKPEMGSSKQLLRK